VLLALGALASSCAYYNTFYLARKYYFKGTGGLPYAVEKAQPLNAQNFPKAIDLAKKVLANHPKSKWVPHAYLLWARALLGREDPRETVNMLQDFDVRFPNSRLKGEALFYLGVGFGRSHRYGEAESAFEQFLAMEPNGELAPYAWLERSRALSSLDRDSAAAFCAGQVLERFPKSGLGTQALAARAEALLQAGDFTRARADFKALGLSSRNDEERLKFLLNEADCLEAGREYGMEMDMLTDALGHEQAPATADAGTTPAQYRPVTGSDRYGRILLRIGTVHLLAGRLKEALDAYRDIVRLYPRSQLSAEAQYRIGYAFETAGDDFARARAEYVRVKDEVVGSAFAMQAQTRVTNLDRVEQFRSAGGDTIQKRAEAGFVLGELYLFQLGKPERALEEYAKVAEQFPGTPWAAKALNAQAWVLSRKLGRKASADSLFWVVVREHPATASQLAARDYLEQEGFEVPDSLIRLPEEPEPQPPPADTVHLTPPPAGAMPLGQLAAADSLTHVLGRPASRHGLTGGAGRVRPAWDPRYAGTSSGAPSVAGDSPFTSGAGGAVAADSTRVPDGAAPAGPVRRSTVPRDSLEGPSSDGGRVLAPPALPDTAAAFPGRPRPPRADSTRFER
jgi:tetratricopeptide (TPR) repeat protein